jgi:hypothetical protein
LRRPFANSFPANLATGQLPPASPRWAAHHHLESRILEIGNGTDIIPNAFSRLVLHLCGAVAVLPGEAPGAGDNSWLCA